MIEFYSATSLNKSAISCFKKVGYKVYPDLSSNEDLNNQEEAKTIDLLKMRSTLLRDEQIGPLLSLTLFDLIVKKGGF